MKYAIIFEEGERAGSVAQRLDVDFSDIITAFKYWGENDYPQEFFYKTGEGELERGGTYDIGLLIWNYQGGHPHSKDKPLDFGIITKARSWGLRISTGKTAYRQLHEVMRYYFYLEAIA